MEVGEGAWNVQGEKLTWSQHALTVCTVVHVSLSKGLRRDDDIGLIRKSEVNRVGEGRAIRRRRSGWAAGRFGRRGKGDGPGWLGRSLVGFASEDRRATIFRRVDGEFGWRSYGRRDVIEESFVAAILAFGGAWRLFDQRVVRLRRGRLVDGALVVGRGDTLCVFGVLPLPTSKNPGEFFPKGGVEKQEET